MKVSITANEVPNLQCWFSRIPARRSDGRCLQGDIFMKRFVKAGLVVALTAAGMAHAATELVIATV
ncbi:MAG: hypothetical protein EOP78_03145, partial [Variovorax sp.]